MGVARSWSARSSSARRKARSSAGERSASPSGVQIPWPATIRFEPTISATGVIVQMCAVGMPARSSSVAIAAPQRVLVPQVEVRITASTPACRRYSAISRPSRRLLASGLVKPVVLRK